MDVLVKKIFLDRFQNLRLLVLWQAVFGKLDKLSLPINQVFIILQYDDNISYFTESRQPAFEFFY